MKRNSTVFIMYLTLCGALQYTGPVGKETNKWGGKVHRVRSPKHPKKKAAKVRTSNKTMKRAKKK